MDPSDEYIHNFRNNPKYADWQMTTEPVHIGEIAVVFKCTVFNFEGKPMSTGFNETIRSDRVNAVLASENNAIARALYHLGIVPGESWETVQPDTNYDDRLAPDAEAYVKAKERIVPFT